MTEAEAFARFPSDIRRRAAHYLDLSSPNRFPEASTIGSEGTESSESSERSEGKEGTEGSESSERSETTESSENKEMTERATDLFRGPRA
jgi:hypothetical protein